MKGLSCDLTGPRWYVAQTEPRKERFAVANLERQTFRSLFLRYRTTRRHARKIDEILAPVFPGYVFVQFDSSRDPWSAINGTFGVKRLIGVRGGKPQPLPGRVIDDLLARCEGDIVTPMSERLRAGQAVRLVTGPFTDQWATVEHLPASDRVRILLNVLGRETRATVHVGALAPA